MSEQRIEAMLRATGANLDWPATPDIDRALKAALATTSARSAPRPLRPRLARPFAIALAALALLAATAAAVPGIREPVLDWLGLRSVKIERVPRPLPQSAPGSAAAPGSALGLGQRMRLAEAQRRLGFTPVLPTGLGTPTIYFEDFPPGGQLALAYPHHLLTEVEGRIDRQYLAKFLTAGTGVHAVRIDGERGLWIDGDLHQYVFADKTGEIRTDSVRTAGNVLLWRRGPLLLRLEGARTKAQALRIARSLRAAP